MQYQAVLVIKMDSSTMQEQWAIGGPQLLATAMVSTSEWTTATTRFQLLTPALEAASPFDAFKTEHALFPHFAL